LETFRVQYVILLLPATKTGYPLEQKQTIAVDLGRDANPHVGVVLLQKSIHLGEFQVLLVKYDMAQQV
jgi:hypothetical protein